MDKKAYLLVILSSLFYAVYLVVNRIYLLNGVPPLGFACGSIMSAAFFSSIYLVFSNKVKEIKKLDKKSFIYILFLSLIVGIFYRLALFFGQSLTAAANTGFLIRIAPLFALLFGYIFMREAITKRHILIMLVMMSGVFLLVTGGKLITIDLGSSLILFAGMLIGFDQAFSRKIIKRKVDPVVLTSLRMIIGALLLYFITKIYSSFSFVSNWKIYLLSGVLIFLAVLARNLALKQLKASIVSSILLLSPLFTAILGIALLNEKMGSFQLFGGFVILTGGYFLIRNR